MRMHKRLGLIKSVTHAFSFTWFESLAPTLIRSYRIQIEIGSLSRVQPITIGGHTEIRMANLKFAHRVGMKIVP